MNRRTMVQTLVALVAVIFAPAKALAQKWEWRTEELVSLKLYQVDEGGEMHYYAARCKQDAYDQWASDIDYESEIIEMFEYVIEISDIKREFPIGGDIGPDEGPLGGRWDAEKRVVVATVEQWLDDTKLHGRKAVMIATTVY